MAGPGFGEDPARDRGNSGQGDRGGTASPGSRVPAALRPADPGRGSHQGRRIVSPDAFPASTPIQLQVLDDRGLALRSCGWIWARNHQAQGCIGCHEDPELTPPNRVPDALKPAAEMAARSARTPDRRRFRRRDRADRRVEVRALPPSGTNRRRSLTSAAGARTPRRSPGGCTRRCCAGRWSSRRDPGSASMFIPGGRGPARWSGTSSGGTRPGPGTEPRRRAWSSPFPAGKSRAAHRGGEADASSDGSTWERGRTAAGTNDERGVGAKPMSRGSAVVRIWVCLQRSSAPAFRAGADEPPVPVFTDVTEKAGIHFKHSFGDKELSNIVEGTGAGAMFFDYDGDGWLDIYLVNGRYRPDVNDNSGRRLKGKLSNRLYRNNHDGTFTDVTDEGGRRRRRGLRRGLLGRRLRRRRPHRSLRPQLRPERPVPQQRRRHLHRRLQEVGPGRSGLERLGRLVRLQRRRQARRLRGQLPRVRRRQVPQLLRRRRLSRPAQLSRPGRSSLSQQRRRHLHRRDEGGRASSTRTAAP